MAMHAMLVIAKWPRVQWTTVDTPRTTTVREPEIIMGSQGLLEFFNPHYDFKIPMSRLVITFSSAPPLSSALQLFVRRKTTPVECYETEELRIAGNLQIRSKSNGSK